MKWIIIGLAGILAGTTVASGQQAKLDREATVKGNTEFALDLYGKLRAQEVRAQDGNLFFSPYSISTALAMTYAGARGETADEMAKALHFTVAADRLHPAFASLLAETNRAGKKPGYQVSIANALWGQKNFGFLPDFLNLTRSRYGAGLQEVDFIDDTEKARQTINAWVEDKTQQKIKDLLPPGIVNVDTRLVLTNAIYFKGYWALQFKKANTRKEPFKTAAGKSVQAPLMHQKDRFGYFKGSDFQALQMPYQGKDLSMVVLLPDRVDGLAEFEKKLTGPNLAKWLAGLATKEVQVALPKFKMTREFNLNDALTALGMRQAFIAGAADFTGMSGSGRKLFIQAVMHKAFVDVNEEGTEAAAATGVVIGLTSVQITPVFRADHPFVFLIRDNRSGSVLFMGRVTDPNSDKG